ncbi:MAG: cyclic pyranopterin monophosphate synthase MoaC [Pseudomonadota bacterium]
MADKTLTHFDAEGRAVMVDVSGKPDTDRIAVAEGRLRMECDTLAMVEEGRAKKGDVRAIAELAGVMGAKRTSDLIPLCHPLPLSSVRVTIDVDRGLPGLAVRAEARTTGPTGVEMEALTAASVACLTLYDMLKAADKGMTIMAVRLLEKSGGASGAWRREEES